MSYCSKVFLLPAERLFMFVNSFVLTIVILNATTSVNEYFFRIRDAEQQKEVAGYVQSFIC